MKKKLLLRAMLLLAVMVVFNCDAAEGTSLNTQRILRNPVAVLSAPDWFSLSNQVVEVGIQMHVVQRYGSKFGVTIKQQDWDSGMDLMIKHLAKAEAVRPKLETSLVDAKKAGCTYVLFTRFEENNGQKRVLSALVDLSRGDVMGVMDASAESLELAAMRVVGQVEKKLALVRWAATVVKISKGNAVINRGFNDGVRKNMVFNISSVGSSKEDEGEPTELRILTSARSGTCTVIEASENYAIVKAKEKGFKWSTGDLISLPPVMLDKKDPSSRGSAAWNAVYDKNK